MGERKGKKETSTGCLLYTPESGLAPGPRILCIQTTDHTCPEWGRERSHTPVLGPEIGPATVWLQNDAPTNTSQGSYHLFLKPL